MKFQATVVFILTASFLFAQKNIQKIDSFLHVLHAKEKFNGNVLIAEKGNVIYKQSFGLANEMTKEKLNENSIFELASCSKQFTAMAIMQLKEQGKLNLDDKMAKFIPELAIYGNVTVRQLVYHTSGFPDYIEVMDTLFDKSKIATNQDIIRIFGKTQPKVLFEPNTKYEYSNTGYALLATIIERASGLKYADFLKKNIFKPLKMKRSFVYTRRLSPQKIDNYALGYMYSDSLKKYILPDDMEDTKMVVWLDGIVGDGTVNSTVNDLLKWDRALYSNKLLSAEGMKEVFRVGMLEDQSKTDYGFGWQVQENNYFGTMINHSGGWPGYVTQIDRHIDNDKTIILLQNHYNMAIPIKKIRMLLYDVKLSVRNETTISTEKLQTLVGTYEFEKDYYVNITLEKERLFFQITGQKAAPLYTENELNFFMKGIDVQVQFVKNNKGEITQLFLIQDGAKTPAKRL
jgi:CubicO group peptidase (beta-lactamase class C family)